MSEPVPFTVKPGPIGPWRSVQDMRRSQHESSAVAIKALIEARKAKGVPTDDSTDWAADFAQVYGEMDVKDRDELRGHLEKALAIVNGGLRPLPPYADDEGIAGVEVRIRALSKADVLEMRADLATCAYDGDDAAKRLRSSAATQRAVRPFLDKCLVGVRGVQREDLDALCADDLDPGSPAIGLVLDVLDTTGILGAVFTVCRDYQDLSVPQRGRFGLPQAATSPTSIAVPALRQSESFSGATVEQPSAAGSTSRTTLIERPTGAQSATSSTTLGSSTPSISIASAEVSPG